MPPNPLENRLAARPLSGVKPHNFPCAGHKD